MKHAFKQIGVLSGKGGTGKTTVTGAFALLARPCVLADCDVDAADLHLLLQPEIQKREVFAGGKVAEIDKNLCNACGRCRDLCRFDAIAENFTVDSAFCDGCGVCVWNCPEKAISFNQDNSGEWYVSKTRFGPLVHAKLGMGRENSGKLVSLVRAEAERLAEESKAPLVLVDGPPGIACAAMASLAQLDAVLVVTEPTVSGLHDFLRIADLINQFNVRGFVCVNKHDINPEKTLEIERRAREKGFETIGKIPFDVSVVKALMAGKTVLESEEGPAAGPIRALWARLCEKMRGPHGA